MLPTGWFAIMVGAILLLRERIGLRNKRLAYVILVASLTLIALSMFQGLLLDVDYVLGLLHGVKGDFDFESRSNAFFFFLGIAGIFASLLLMAIRDEPELKATNYLNSHSQ